MADGPVARCRPRARVRGREPAAVVPNREEMPMSKRARKRRDRKKKAANHGRKPNA